LASTVYNVEEITLGDGSKVTLKPLSIKNLRVFMPKMQQWQDLIADEKYLERDPMGIEQMILLLEAAVICLTDQKPEWKEDPDLAEDVLDMTTVYRVLEVCGGIKLNDENLLKATQEAMVKAEAGRI
jgi:hypothetical protein